MNTVMNSTDSMDIAIDSDALARAALTCCIDGADAIMYATIKGVGSASDVLQLIIESRPQVSEAAATAANKTLERGFIDGLIRWGRQPNARSMNAFHTTLAGWHRRLGRLPSLHIESLTGWLTAEGTQWIIGPNSPYWPHQLDDLSIRRDWAAPLCLWGIGDPGALVSCPAPIAVVGSRGVNEYGRVLARHIGERAAADGHLVVSGGAMGADAAAHWGALAAMESAADPNFVGRTVAVFAGGLNHVGPQCNQLLFDRIVALRGALISELCPNTIPEARRFLLRNRIIAALGAQVIVTQARLRSGALNTAGWAAELGREVYAAPGDAGTPHNAGCNKLIRDHQAILLMSADDTRDICHQAHHPVIAVSSDAGSHQQSQDVQSQEKVSAPSSQQQALVATEDDGYRTLAAAIRRCRAKRLRADVETVASCMDGAPSMPDVFALLGRLELEGLIAINNGVISLTNTQYDTASPASRS